jgi:parvulin-like peptidyl-prolyl isomerase
MAFLPTVAIALALAQGPGSITGDIPAKYRMPVPGANAPVARVNGVEIKASDVESVLWEWRGFDAIQDLISYQVVRAEAQKLRIDVSEKEVEDAMDAGLRDMQSKLEPGKSLDLALLETGFTRSRLFLRYRTEALLNAIVARSFNPKSLVKVSTISFHIDNEQVSSVSDAISKASAAYGRLKKGDSWDAVLASATNIPQVLKSKGLLGWRDLSAFPATVRTELEQLAPGGITKPAQTTSAIQIFRLEADSKTAKPEDLVEMRNTYINASKKPLLDRLRKEAVIERLYPPIPGLNSQKDGN